MRKKNSLKNFFTDIVPYFVFAIIGFIQIRIFINNLGEEIYSLNQLFIQLFSYISLVEGGVGAIISQQYYKLLVNDDKMKIKELYFSSKKAMKNISILILIIGIIVSFTLKLITNNSLTLQYMQFVFLLYIIRSIVEYLNLPPRFVIQADQKLYKINLKLNFFKFIEAILQLCLIYYKLDYIIILIVSIIIRLIMYKVVNSKIYTEYPWLNRKENITPKKVSGIGYMFYHKIAGAVYNNVDILLISAKMEPLYVTAYSSYNYLTRYINDVIYMLGNSLMASLGNVIYKESNETSRKIFEELLSFFMFLGCFFSINMLMLSKNFVNIWIGEEYQLDNIAIVMMSFLLFISISKRIVALLCEANGFYKETKNIVILEAISNLVLSIVLLNFYGINGVIFATIISYFLTTFWYYPRFIYSKIYKNGIEKYIKVYVVSILLLIFGLIASLYINYNVKNFIDWFLFACVNSIVSGCILIIIFYFTNDSFKSIIKKFLLLIKGR